MLLNISNKYFGNKELDEATEVTNKYFGKKEQEAAMDFTSESKIQTENEDKGINEHPSTLIDGSDDMVQKQESLGTEKNNEDPSSNVSIDVTKALLLLGINSWSNLEPGRRK